jgi:hypothetical protein
MGKPFGKASACLREAASAKAGANLLSNLALWVDKDFPALSFQKTAGIDSIWNLHSGKINDAIS